MKTEEMEDAHQKQRPCLKAGKSCEKKKKMMTLLLTSFVNVIRYSCGRGHSYQARPPVGGWGNPWDLAGSRASLNSRNKEPRTKLAGMRWGVTPRAISGARPTGVGERCRASHKVDVPVAAPIATEGSGSRSPTTLFTQFTCEGALGGPHLCTVLEWCS